MKLIACIVFVCFFLLTDAGRVPDISQIGSSDSLLEDIKNVQGNTEQSHIRKRRHYNSRYYSERGMDRSYDSERDDRITELEIRQRVLQEQLNYLQSRTNEVKVVVVPVFFPSNENNSTNSLSLSDNRFTGVEKERIWGDATEYTGVRPISLKPARPSRPMSQQPPVEHGTIQAETSTREPSKGLTSCKIAILVCCDSKESEKKSCFEGFSCSSISELKYTCHPTILDKIKSEFVDVYGPVS